MCETISLQQKRAATAAAVMAAAAEGKSLHSSAFTCAQVPAASVCTATVHCSYAAIKQHTSTSSSASTHYMQVCNKQAAAVFCLPVHLPPTTHRLARSHTRISPPAPPDAMKRPLQQRSRAGQQQTFLVASWAYTYAEHCELGACLPHALCTYKESIQPPLQQPVHQVTGHISYALPSMQAVDRLHPDGQHTHQ